MITALLVIFDPIPTWDRIAVTHRKWSGILVFHLLPLLLLVSVVEGYGLMHWGKPRGTIHGVRELSFSQTTVFEAGQLLLSLLVVFVSAKLVKALGETFHGRHSLTEAFTATAYGLGPLFLLRLFNAIPSMPPYVTWGIGIVLSVATLYHGLPRVMRPDPPHAFGLYLMSAVLLLMITGLACFLTTWYLQGKFGKLDDLITHFIPG
jgi:hypothetical protein